MPPHDYSSCHTRRRGFRKLRSNEAMNQDAVLTGEVEVSWRPCNPHYWENRTIPARIILHELEAQLKHGNVYMIYSRIYSPNV